MQWSSVECSSMEFGAVSAVQFMESTGSFSKQKNSMRSQEKTVWISWLGENFCSRTAELNSQYRIIILILIHEMSTVSVIPYPAKSPNSHIERLRFIRITFSQTLSNYSILNLHTGQASSKIYSPLTWIFFILYWSSSLPLLFYSPSSWLPFSFPVSSSLLELEVPPILCKALFWLIGFY